MPIMIKNYNHYKTNNMIPHIFTYMCMLIR